MKKLLILGIVLCSLLIVSINSATAIEETQSITDDRNDVLDYNAETEEDMYVSNKPNIDITKLEYRRVDDSVTIELTVKGKIENRGDIEDVYSEDPESISVNYVVYSFIMASVDGLGYYEINYVNNACRLTYYSSDLEEETENFTEDQFDVQDDTLNINFKLKNATETFEEINALTTDAKISLSVLNFYIDIAPDDEFDPDGNGDSSTNGNGGTLDPAFFLFIGLIVVIAVAGVIVLILIIKR